MPLNNTQIEELLNDSDDETDIIKSSLLNLNLILNNDASEKSFVSSMNKLLSSAKTKLNGLETLNVVIDNCSKEIIASNAIFWINQCMVKYSEDVLKELKLSVIGKIVENAHTESEFTKKFVSEYMSKVLDTCLNTFHISNSYSQIALNTLTICIKYYPSWFGSYKEKIEKFLVCFLDSKSELLVEKSGKCFHLLQQVGGAGSEGINHRQNFTKSFDKVCCTIHSLFDEFFVNEQEFFHFETSLENNVFKFKEINAYSSAQKIQGIIARRLKNCIVFLDILIRTKFMVVKEIKPKELLTVITRGLAMHLCVTNNSEHTVETYRLSLLLTQIQIQLLNILRVLIFWYRTNLLPFSYAITKVLVDTLNKTQKCQCFSINCLYQEAIYKCINSWLEICKSSLNIHFQNQIILCILKDITPTKSEITLSINTNLSKSAKARKKAMNEKIISSNTQSKNTENKNLTIKNDINKCYLALKTLKNLLFYSELKIKPELLQTMYNTVFQTLNDIQTLSPPHPYNDPNCQTALYDVLVAIFEQETVSALPPLHLALDALNKGATALSGNRFVGEVCRKGLAWLEKFCQPMCPSLYLNRGDQRQAVGDVLMAQPNDVDSNGSNSDVNSEYNGSSIVDDDHISTIDLTQNKKCLITILDDQIIKPVDKEDLDPSIVEQTVSEIPEEERNLLKTLDEIEEIIDLGSVQSEEEDEKEIDIEPPTKKLRQEQETIIIEEQNVIQKISEDKVDENDVVYRIRSKKEENVVDDDTKNTETKEIDNDDVISVEEDGFVDEEKDY